MRSTLRPALTNTNIRMRAAPPTPALARNFNPPLCVRATISLNAQGVSMQIPLSQPDITEREIERVCQVLRSGKLSLGPCVPEFEERFASYVGTRFAVAVNSGTSALHLITRALGIGSGDEVITTS